MTRKYLIDQSTGNPVQDDIFYSVLAPGLANGASVTKSVQINGDSDFFAQKISFWADTNGTYTATPLVTMELVDAASGKQLTPSPVPLSTIAGSGELPFLLPMVRQWVANSQIQVTLANFSTATSYTNLYVVFSGIRRYLA